MAKINGIATCDYCEIHDLRGGYYKDNLTNGIICYDCIRKNTTKLDPAKVEVYRASTIIGNHIADQFANEGYNDTEIWREAIKIATIGFKEVFGYNPDR